MRNNPLISLLAVAVLCTAAVGPAHAQRQSLADRMTALELRAANDRGNLDLLNQMGQLRTEVQQLRSMVEELQNENRELSERNRAQYLDLDGRLNRLEGGAPGVPPVAPPSIGAVDAPAAPAMAGAGDAFAATDAAGTAVTATEERAPSVHGDVGAMAQAGDERAAYGVAFDALKNGSYADAAQLFLSFLELYPNGAYAPNALYWLGESYYVTQNYGLAAQQFRALLAAYPTHDKASGSMLKLGLAEFGLGEVDQAEQTLASVIQQYPGSDVARTADARLRSIQVSRLR